MKALGLTLRQSEVLALIERRAAESRVAPSFQEIVDELGLASKSEVHRIVNALEERGAIHRLPGRRRAIALGRDRKICCPHCKERFNYAVRIERAA